MESLTQFQQIVGENVAQFVQELDEDYLAPALSLLIAANDRGNRIHITGIGKPSHVAQYGASLMSSIAELKATVLAVQNNGCKVIGISRSPDSWLARHADVHLTVRVDQEGGPMNRAPISSVLLENIVLQALSVRLQAHYGLTPQEYVRHHPGGTLGRLRPEEQEAGHG